MDEMTDIELIGYCEIHCATERALFAAEHVNRMIELAGNPLDFRRQSGWVSAHGEMQELCDLARARLVPPAPAIAPPVAAGSVDTEELRKLALAATPGDQWQMNNDGGQFGLRVNSGYQGFFNHQRPNQKCTDEVFANVAYILAAKPSVVLSLIERAEKAEVELAQVNQWRAAALASNQQLHELMVAKLATAEDRVKNLGAEDLAMHRKLAAETLRADQGWARYEAANRAKNDLQREKAGSASPFFDGLPNEVMRHPV